MDNPPLERTGPAVWVLVVESGASAGPAVQRHYVIRRMKRRLFNLLTYGSLVLGAIMALLWLASCLKAIHATAALAETDWHLSAESGRVVAWTWPSSGSAAFTGWITL